MSVVYDLPHSAERERSILGAVMIEPPSMDEVLTVLEPDDFYVPRHRQIYQTMADLWRRGEPIDFVTVEDELRRTQRDENPAGYLTGLIASSAGFYMARPHLQAVKRYAVLRRYIAMAGSLAQKAYARDESPDELYTWLQEQLRAIAYGADSDEGILEWEQSFIFHDDILAQRALDAQLPDAQRDAWNWPWRTWNNLLDPADAGGLIVVGGGPGIGKTVVGECIAEHWARRGNRVVYVHMELNDEWMMDRRLARHTGYNRRFLKAGRFDSAQKARLERIKQDLLSWQGNITYLYRPGRSAESIILQLRRLLDTGLCDAAVIDYLEKHEMSPAQMRRFRQDGPAREAHDVEQYKTFADEQGIRLVMLSQLNKQGRTADFKSLNMANLRGAGEKSEKANVAILLHRERVEGGEVDEQGRPLVEPGGLSRELQVRVDKNTMGATGSFTQVFHGETYSITDWD